MKSIVQKIMTIAIMFMVTSWGLACSPIPGPSPTPTTFEISPTTTIIPTSTQFVTPTPTEITDEILDLQKLISEDSLFSFIERLTSIQAYSGWRNSGTEGEAEALDYVTKTLGELTHLESLGLELERQSFHVFLATEIWENRLFLTINGLEVEAPTNGINGHRKDILQALRFDSDGALNDTERNPIEVTSEALLLRSADDIQNLEQDMAQGKIVFLDYRAIDPETEGEATGARLVSGLIHKDVAGVVLVTEKGHSKYAGDGTMLEDSNITKTIPMLYVRLEDLKAVGIEAWKGLAQIESARLTWDSDVFSPGTSGNLVARIPGADSSRAMVLGAHIDSLNSPGGGDNGLNCAVLLELARVLDEGKVKPPVDIYLVWLGSEDLGFYGSQHFVNTHQEVLDQTIAAFMMDGFTADTPGPTILGMQESPHSRFGNVQLPFAEYLEQQAQGYQIPIEIVFGSGIFSSDDGPFYGFVPHVRFAFGSNKVGRNFHSPYDTIENVADQGEVMKQSVTMGLIAALKTPLDKVELHVTPKPEHRAVFIATHTEVLHMSPTMLINFDRALAWEGFDVDVIPYGQTLTQGDLADTDLVIALPVIDYPTADSDLSLYDETWSAGEIDLLVDYVENGGMLVLTNSANRLFFGEIADANEDWEKINPLAAAFGIRYEGEPFSNSLAYVIGDNPLTESLNLFYMDTMNSLPIEMEMGEPLAKVDEKIALGLVDFGEEGGQVLALPDIKILHLYDFGQSESNSITFLRNLASYARER